MSALEDQGILEKTDTYGIYRTTPRGKALVDMLCTTPLPEMRFIDPRDAKRPVPMSPFGDMIELMKPGAWPHGMGDTAKTDANARAAERKQWREEKKRLEADAIELAAQRDEAEKALRSLGYEKHGFGWGIGRAIVVAEKGGA
jgi:hypothetical protein